MRRVPLLSLALVLACATIARSDDLPYEDSRHLDSFDGRNGRVMWTNELRVALGTPEAEAQKDITDLDGYLNQVRERYRQAPKVVERRAKVERMRLLLDEIHGRRPPGPLPGDRPLEDKDERAMGGFDGGLESHVLTDLKARPEPAVRAKLAELSRALDPYRDVWNHELRSRRYRLHQLEGQVTAAFGTVPRAMPPELIAEFKRRFDEKQAVLRRISDAIRNPDEFKRHETVEAVGAELRALAELDQATAPVRAFIAEFTATWGNTSSVARNNLARIYGRGDPVQLPTGVSWPFDWAFADSIASATAKLALPRVRSERIIDVLMDTDHPRRLKHALSQAVRVVDFNLLDELDKSAALLTETARLAPNHARLRQAVAGFPAERAKAQELLLAKIEEVEWPDSHADEVDDALVRRIAAEFPGAYAIRIPEGWNPVMEKRVGDTILSRKDGSPMGWAIRVQVARRIRPDEPAAALLTGRACDLREYQLIAEPEKRSPWDRTNEVADNRLVSLAKVEASAAELKRLVASPGSAPRPPVATPAPEAPEEETSSGETSSGETSSGETSSGETSSGETSSAEAPSFGGTSGAGAPVVEESSGVGMGLLAGVCVLLVVLAGGVLVVGAGVALYLKSQHAAAPAPPALPTPSTPPAPPAPSTPPASPQPPTP